MQRVGRRWLEVEMLVEPPCALVLGVDEKDVDAERIGGLEDAEHRIAQEQGPETAALIAPRDREPRQERHWNRVTRHALARAGWRVCVLDRRDGERVVPRYVVV